MITDMFGVQALLLLRHVCLLMVSPVCLPVVLRMTVLNTREGRCLMPAVPMQGTWAMLLRAGGPTSRGLPSSS